MARRKARALPGSTDGLPVMPLRLVDKTRRSSEELREVSAESGAWFRAHGIDAGDWGAVYPILLASWAAHGIPSAMDRARARHKPKGNRTARP